MTDSIILALFAIAINAAALIFGLPPALKAMKAGQPYNEWDEGKGRYVKKLSGKVKLWQTDAGKIWLIAQVLTIAIAIGIFSFLNSY
jgi:hypothetical protein